MADLAFPYLSAAVAAPLAGAAVAALNGARARLVGVLAAAGATLCSLAAFVAVHQSGGARLAEPWGLSLFTADPLNATFLLLYSLLTLGIIALAPRRDTTATINAGTLLVLAATLAAYAADNAIVLALGWLVSALPFILGPFHGTWRPRVGLALSCLALLGALGAIARAAMADGATQPYSLAALQGHNYGGSAAFGLLITAIVFRKGIFPAHAWIEDAAEAGPVLPFCLFLNGHLGAFVLARVVIPEFPLSAQGAFPILSDLALFTALYAAVRAVAESSARRILALLVLSQSACILAGLESATPEGITGALVHCMVVAVATTGLFSVLRLMEVRFGRSFTTSHYLGLARYTPRLGVLFAVCGLALVGLPGTLGFCSEDLLIHGTLVSHPQIGLLLPVATAMNAVSLFRLFSKIFLGDRAGAVFGVTDAVPRERWVLAAIALFLVVAGLTPATIVGFRTQAAQTEQEKAGGPLPPAPHSAILAESCPAGICR
ncbi:MAG: proton-conducting transporter membrane subunit [Acidobacteria bacterium]|nr:proton-conducting transporter membrane subunit [Acidobacteriota bacterium]